jgi:restriction system protein
MSEPDNQRQDAAQQPGSTVGRARLRPSGGYRRLRSFHVATIIYDATVSFCERFVDKRSRTTDQMVQAARSGRQNIAEGSRAAATSSQTELRLVNVARASLDELLLDYEDFLRHRGLPLWSKEDDDARSVRSVGKQFRVDSTDPRAADYSRWLNHGSPAIAANAIICLIHQANYLLDQQVSALERDFVTEGGYSEQLAAARRLEREKQSAGGTKERLEQPPIGPACPRCARPMALRTARNGAGAGSQFWGCTSYPECKGTRPVAG